ncbi:MAG: class I SAM-dependent methyltransferase [Leptospiraceae bacterium]|nr:class I SAM-dependent methyltransferase [Leptospiraceae bacterium]MDW8307467.1 class I SAM-dependent methyltransferase [Leptospiraceae bacterium]
MVMCPVCDSPTKVVEEPFYRCPRDGLLVYAEGTELTYEDDYFGLEYKNQYGKTYLEDREAILARNHWRLKEFHTRIRLSGKKKRLLEVGCAYGFFLEAAKNYGYELEGWELSQKAAQYCQNRGFAVKVGDFFALYENWQKQKRPPYDVVAAFYTIEHFRWQRQFWSAAAHLVSRGGYLLLSLPSCWGPLFYFHRRKWYENHPRDHFVDYSPRSLAKIGKSFGFKLLLTKSEGIHPNRFWGGSLPFLRSFFRKIQEKIPFSDTIYAVLRKDRDESF